MKTLWFSLTLITLFLLNSNAFAGFYVITGAGGKPVGIEITSLPATISSSGFYYITEDLTCAAGSHGITITADDVTLDLMGFSLIGPGGSGVFAGIYMDGRSNITIRNGSVMRFSGYGIVEDNSSVPASAHSAINLRVKENGATGIRLVGFGHRVEGCTVANNGHNGIYVFKGATVINNRAYGNEQHGIFAAYGCVISDNTAVENGGDGIRSYVYSKTTDNACYDNIGYGISGSSSLVANNSLVGNDLGNIDSCPSCTLVNNHIGAF